MTYVTILGLFAASCTTFCFIPQAVKAIKSKKTKDISLGMYSVLNIGILSWLSYGILINDLPLMASNTVTLLFTSSILYLKIKHG